ncbi:hypothetical protein L4X63_16915 [Geomonas sp. Red32]|uniref:hypothetical protein n=1 Tax=Geomonas sp. Red32 TaxID=2912856 RepID=UPI00202D0927|nr:hypothetical protein [Geomonas sp. Red32]MCM0083269.1 hypothetical protein [Geomonas sp. Red32]
MNTIDQLNDRIDAIHDQYDRTSPEYKTILALNGHLFRVLKPEARPEARDSIKALLTAHLDQPTLYKDMLGIVELFTGMVEAAQDAA